VESLSNKSLSKFDFNFDFFGIPDIETAGCLKKKKKKVEIHSISVVY
jgi:hypothetical protein